ncbi:hypothetical protein BBK36DRAFT_1169860 [Trichoderma citrinoviride]|uniref:Uncharacterized protein n=1 Tax=Trichoderma citrinoviride TaxID=58853 RepID=A0A2T4B6X7_9HYPO|nr:hypothetical protein BBK36DRAFT_1169860 [Trichoderma citrinoviride]PTB65084.1 hypothetical protein BBK36DRAFT_1169860 [Trichoderma citrinoviride]
MSRSGDEGLELSSDDDLIEVQFDVSQASAPSSRGHSIFENLLHPQGVPSRGRPAADSTMAGSVSLRPTASHSRRPQPAQSSTASQPRGRHSHPQSQQASMLRAWAGASASSSESRPPATTYIDLTDEPDSPVERRRTQASDPQAMLQQVPNNIAGRHPRRTNSQRISPPQLARSDSTLVGGPSSYIDLTVDEDEQQQQQQRSGREHWRTRAAHQHPHHHHHNTRHGDDRLVALRLMSGSHQEQLESGIRVLGRTLADFLNGSLGATLSQSRFPAEPESRPKPPMEPIPSATAGFTRDTRADGGQSEELVTICPACNEELAYDPTESSTPSKKRKRAVGEHHFWALKSCGHVYCAECFENRKPTKNAPEGVGFRYPPGKSNATPNDILCAVDGCGTKVASKTEWVGIFL